MITKTMTAKEARDNFSELLGSVYYTNNPVIVERKGKPFAVVISPEQFEVLKGEQEKAWKVIEEIQARNAHLSEEEVMADVTRVVEEVRQERYGKSSKSATKSSN